MARQYYGPKAFRDAIEQTGCLNFKAGLSAIKRGEGRGDITAKDNSKALGGADIDGDCRDAYPNDNRWDYALGYNRSNEAIAFFIEVHGAGSHDVDIMEKKLNWLQKTFLQRASSRMLSCLKREYHWVLHGRFNIPKHVPQYKELLRLQRRLNGPTKSLELQ